MPSNIDQTLLTELETLDTQARYDYLIEQIVKNQQVWILVGSSGSVLLNNEGDDCVPVWPHQQSAEAWIKEEWADCKAQSISLADWQKRWTPGLQEDKYSVAAFPNLQEVSLVIGADEFDQDLLEAESS